MTEKQSNEFEVQAREELLRRLEHPKKLIKAAAEKEHAKRVELYEKSLGDYNSQEAIDEAWAFEMITQEEKWRLEDALEKGESIIDEGRTPVEAAVQLLTEFCGRLAREAQSFRFDNLPAEEQERIRAEHERLHAEIEKRKRRNSGE